MNSAYQMLPGSAASRLLLVCDHASDYIPDDLADLGLESEHRRSHIAWDIGAAALTRSLAERWQARALLASVSRLVVDFNRAPYSPGWMPAESCGITVPGNQGLSEAEIKARKQQWYDPYHHALAETLSGLSAPVLLAIHSFTPTLQGAERPWHVGILWNQDGRLALPLMEGLRSVDGVVVGDNEPYTGQLYNHTLDFHAGVQGVPHVSIEVRQDLIDHEAGVAHWSGILFNVLSPILRDMGL